MYLKIVEEMEDAGVSVRLKEQVWMDREGNVVEEGSAFGCKVTHRINHPKTAIFFDKTGRNTSQKGDGHKGGQLLMCEKGETTQTKISTRGKHYTVMGLTSLTGEPVMCVVLFSREKPNALCELCLDLSAETFGSLDNPDYTQNNSGPGRGFPGGPTYNDLAKEVPCFCAWSEKGGVTSEILMSILASLDKY